MKQVFCSGLGTFSVSSRKAVFVYTGNQGNSMRQVRECFENMFAPGAWEEFVKIAQIKHDDPGYLWQAEITLTQYQEHLAAHQVTK